MKKAIAILLTALLLLTVFVSCEGDVEDLFGKTVSFNGNGSTSGQMAEMKVKKGEEVTLPANEFTRTDYVFAGWNTQADGSGTGYADKAKASFDDNTVLYAQWAEELTITFNANDGSETPATKTQKVGKGIETALDANTFTRTSYYFAGWSSSAQGDVEYADGATVTLESNLVLYAIWSVDPVVTLTKGTGISEVTGAGSYAPGTEVTINATVADGYTWSKWTQTTGGADVSTTKAYSFTMGTENINYTANATANTYTVTLETNGGTIATGKDVTSYTYGVGATLPTASDITKSGNSFGGWYANSECTGDAVTSISTTDTGDKIFYAQWSEKAVVTFHKNDEVTPESTTTQLIPFNTETALTENSFSRDTYIFLGWNTAKDGTGTAYSDEQKVTLTANLDLYAQWAIDLATTTLSKTSWTNGNVYSMSADVLISDRITVTGSVTLILPADTTLTASKGITVTRTVTGTNSLTINGKGSLSAGGSSTPEHAAGIGGIYQTGEKDGGTVTINGGIVTATGGKSAAGIGGCTGGAGGTVTINGGTVTATGGSGTFPDGPGTGIGAGYKGSSHGTLTIANGVIMMVSTNNTDWSVYSETRTRYMKTPTILTSSTKAWQNDVYSMTANLTIYDRITVTGSVTLILPEGKTLTAYKGITVNSGNSLTINGEGTLNATGALACAGIGGDSSNKSEGTVTINGGTVIANGGPDSAGIGGAGSGDVGTVTINGGVVEATGGNEGAGIGSGNLGSGGTVTITGGTVTATGGQYAAGIGGGNHRAGGTVSISGGTVTATGGVDAAGIGAGKNSSSHGTLKIGAGCALTGGSASADTLLLGPVNSETPYTGASHPRFMNVSTVSEIKDSTSAITLKSGVYTTDKDDTEVVVNERITVEGSVFLLLPDGKTLTASKGITVSSGNTLVIDKYGSTATGTGILNATGGEKAAGIGGGNYGAGGTIKINGGTVAATGGQWAAGIGGGHAGAGGTVTINGGAVTANGGQYAVGIGAGYGTSNHGTLKIGTGMALYGDSTSPAHTEISGATESYTGDRFRYMKADKVN